MSYANAGRPPSTIRPVINLGVVSYRNFPGDYDCPTCKRNAWTLPWNEARIMWHCVWCHVNFDPKEEKMDLKVARKLTEALIDAGIGVSLREDYSGRGMYGATTPALVLDSHDLVEMGRIAGQIGLKSRDVPRRQDNMGLKVVVY